MEVRCPKCDDLVLLDDDDILETVQCPTCKTAVEIIQMLSFSDETTRLDVGANEEVRLKPGDKIAHYVLMRELGSGGFGRVYLAQDNKLDRQVALKVPRAGRLSSNEVKVFIREARTTAQLRDPNILVVHEVGRHRDIVYIASDFIDGLTLAEQLRKDGPMRPRDAAQLCAKIARSLHRAHTKHIVHRDLKSGNILLDESGEPYIADFGLAKRSSSEELTIAQPGEILGTPSYMPPEQASGRSHHVDARADIYSLGAILYETITGKRLFGGSRDQVIEQIRSDQLPPTPRELNRRIPVVLDSICRKAIAKNPDDRFDTACEMGEELERFLRQQPTKTIPQTWSTQMGLFAGRRWRELSVGLLGVMIVALVLVLRPQTSPPIDPDLRSVVIATEPPGARIALAKIDDKTGYPDNQSVIRPKGETPLTLNLEPGRYFIVAMIDGDRFHEVFRTVPESTDEAIMTYRSRQWQVIDEQIHWPKIQLGLAPPMGIKMISVNASSSSNEHLADFLMSQSEITYQQLHGVNGFASITSTVPQDWPVRDISYGRALEYAELIGCRLPTWDEFKFAATNGRTTRYPWGPEPERGETWEFGPAGFAEYDCTLSEPAICGLLSNVAEWTVTTFVPQGNSSMFVPGLGESRIVAGGTSEVCVATPDQTVQVGAQQLQDAMRLPSFRLAHKQLPGVGFRCVRSAKPKWLAE